MNIVLRPVPGDTVVNVRVEATSLTINGQTHAWETLGSGPGMAVADDTVVIDYGAAGGVSTIRLTNAHSVTVLPSDLPPPPPAKEDPAAIAQANLEAQRQSWVCDRWQIKTVLGQERWETILAFGANPYASWGLKTLIDDAMQIPRVSETVEVLAYILGLSDKEVDDLFRTAMALTA